jgi:hypothetical protein
MKLVILETFKWSLFGLLGATKLVIIRSSFCKFSMNTKPGNTAYGFSDLDLVFLEYLFLQDLVCLFLQQYLIGPHSLASNGLTRASETCHISVKLCQFGGELLRSFSQAPVLANPVLAKPVCPR